MTVEATLTRKFGIIFIDARTLTTSARLNLGIHHYPSEEEKMLLIDEASRLFSLHPKDQQHAMQIERVILDTSKRSTMSSSISSFSDWEDCGSSYIAVEDGTRYSGRRSSAKSLFGDSWHAPNGKRNKKK